MHLKFRFHTVFSTLIAALAFQLAAQQDFNDYKPLRAAGDIPEDFTMPVDEKVKRDIREQKTGKSPLEEKIFFEGVHYPVNDLLQSGIVVYGDEVSLYVQQVADKLLAKDENVRKKLRFYTIRSNQTNAFSTYQGIIFVTTGLLSQLTSEAQLAYVLAHEISHFTENHVVQTFDYRQSNKHSHERIKDLSKFSKENELEADKLGLKLYYDAGYSQDQLLLTFDVLLYSYLPFDEVEFPASYVNTELMTVPGGFFATKKYEITAVEDADDSKSSHPNIKKRKEAVQKALENYKDWGNSASFFGKEKFEYIRTICRFESVRNDILDAEFDDALYSIFLLEKKYPNSLYLNRMKAKAWLGFSEFKIKGGINAKLPSESDLEGEIAALQHFMKQLDKNQVLTVSLRKVEDIKKQYPSDPMIAKIHERLLKAIVDYEKLDFNKFSTKTYETAYREYQDKQKDTVQVKSVENTEGLSKYDRIKLNKATEREVVAFDTSSFYLYALPDLVGDSLFLKHYSSLKEELREKKKEQARLNAMSYRELKKMKKAEAEISSLVYLDPVVISRSKRGYDRVKAEQLREQFVKSTEDLARLEKKDITSITPEKLLTGGSDLYNRHALLMSYFSELAEAEGEEVFSTDYMELTREFANDSCLAFTVVVHNKQVQVNLSMVVISILFYPVAFVYVPYMLATKNEIDMTVLLVNPHTSEIIKKINTSKRAPLNPSTIRKRVKEFFEYLG